MREHIDEFISHCTRGPSALETPINDPKKTTTVPEYGYTYTNTEIEVDESRQR